MNKVSIKLSFQTNWDSSKLEACHCLSSFLAVCFKARSCELYQRANLFWLITFLFREATLSSVVRIETIVLSTRESSSTGVKSVLCHICTWQWRKGWWNQLFKTGYSILWWHLLYVKFFSEAVWSSNVNSKVIKKWSDNTGFWGNTVNCSLSMP